MNGNEAILFWNEMPIACLTSNSMSEVASFLTTCKTTQAGALKFIPQAHSYTLNFEGVFIQTADYSWENLSTEIRKMVKGGWFISGLNESGFGYLESLEMTAAAGDIITFSGNIVGVGEIISGEVAQYVWFQNVDCYVNNAGNYVFVKD